MASATYYVDNVNGNNGNTGLSEAQAFADIPTAIAAISGGGNTIYVQAGSNYTITSTIALTAALKGDTTNGRNRIEGYTTVPGARDGRPIITSATNSVALFTLNDYDFTEFVHLKLTHTAGTRGVGITTVTSTSTPVWIKDCIFDGCLSASNAAATAGIFYWEGCEVMNCTSSTVAIGVGSTVYCYGCDIHDNAGNGITGLNGSTTTINVQDCIFDTNLSGISTISTSTNIALTAHGCVFVDNSVDGIKIAALASNTVTLELENNVFYNNTGVGLNQLDTQAETDANVRINRNNAYGANGTAIVGLTAGYGDITLSADPFTSRAARNFTPNSTAGGGASLRAAAFPTTFPGGTSPSYQAVGAVEPQAAGFFPPPDGLIKRLPSV